uniref:Zinc finger and BTB domain containing 40 n=1 Tax=Sphenodon punctatus TaxID=8508 RepID=A0A8D0G7I6_SPHPU
MELPNYSRQLLQQLYTLCKEQQFCDCTIFIGTMHFRAHKLVLAAASLLFKSLLDSTDTISIDASVVAPDEFALLLEMVYTGKLPLGKHNFTKVISVADSLQMFDVAVSCKNLLRDLISCSAQDQVVRDISIQTIDASRNNTGVTNPPKTDNLPEDDAVGTLLSGKVSPGPAETGVETVVPTRVLSPELSLLENSVNCQLTCCFSSAEMESKTRILDFLLHYESVFSEALSSTQAVLKRLEECKEIEDSQREVILCSCEDSTPRVAVENLLRKVTEEKTLEAESLVKLLGAVKASFPDLHVLLDGLVAAQHSVSTGTEHNSVEICSICSDKIPTAKISINCSFFSLPICPFPHFCFLCRSCPAALRICKNSSVLNPFVCFSPPVATSENAAIEIILRHSKLISEAISQTAGLEGLAPGEVELTETVKELLSISSQKEISGASLKAAVSTAMEKSVPAIKICHLLCSVHESFPGLQPVMQELEHVGLLTEGSGEKAGIRKWKVNNDSQIEALDKEEEKAGEVNAKEPEESTSSRKNFVCKACGKNFYFYCRLKVHMKRCRVAKGKQVGCKECSMVKTSKKELEKHQLEVHGGLGAVVAIKKKKKRHPVTCDICGREFAHASGMQYHRLTEHFDEKPFSCDECGAKFAANSTLKNHQRLHTGDRPFLCKHCLMAFSQASALAYHTKKQHSEGKMYACQYCDAVFAQSIELSRHVRTHTGDKPYVCRECGKGFRQANGLSIHLRTFHNIEDPYDCKKCRMSFPTLQEHRKHIHETHSREYHPCPTCGKIFSAPSLLERHMVTHVGGKPFSCESCDKAYQQLSGLWYHNRTHHPDVFAAQNHRSSKFSSLQCSSCDKTFSSTTAHKKHVKAEHTDVKFHACEQCKEPFPMLALLQVHVKGQHSDEWSHPFRCLYCSASFCLPGAVQHHITTEHFKQAESTFSCRLCGELFTVQEQLEAHYSAEHPKVAFAGAQATTAHVVQVIRASDQGAVTEQVITLEETQLAGSQVFVTLPESQEDQVGTELVTVTMEDLLADKVTLICEEAK